MENKEQKNQKSIVAYCRLWSKKESIELQKREIEKYAQEKGIGISKWYIDETQLNGCTSRREFQFLLKDSKKKQFSQVLVYKIEALSQFQIHVDCYKRILRQRGVSLVEVISKEETKGGETNV